MGGKNRVNFGINFHKSAKMGDFEGISFHESRFLSNFCNVSTVPPLFK